MQRTAVHRRAGVQLVRRWIPGLHRITSCCGAPGMTGDKARALSGHCKVFARIRAVASLPQLQDDVAVGVDVGGGGGGDDGGGLGLGDERGA